MAAITTIRRVDGVHESGLADFGQLVSLRAEPVGDLEGLRK